MAYEVKFPVKIKNRINSGAITDQKMWSFIKELNSFDDAHLDAMAIYDGYREYTYRQMFRKWDRYAEVFSALGLTGKNKTRVGVLADFASEPLFALYALNMTGASVSMIHMLDIMDVKRWDKLIEKEGLTDLILFDRKLAPELLERIVASKGRGGIRNVIVLHSNSKNTLLSPEEQMQFRKNYKRLKKVEGALFMNELLKKYEAYPITYGTKTSKNDAVIMHTSGTTNGVHKPIPISDLGANEAASRLLRAEQFQKFERRLTSTMFMDPTSAYVLFDMIHLPFAFGGRLIISPNGLRGPQSWRLVKEYEVNILFGAPIVLDMLMKIPITFDLSTIEFVFLGGSPTSVDQKKRYNAFLKKCGSKARVTIGYGITEAAGAVILSTPKSKDESMGTPLPGVKVKIFDEVDEKYYDLEDGTRTGVLLISTPSVSSGKFNGIQFFKLEEIDGEKYLNTYDLVHVNENGTMTYIGRMNKFFVNNEGIRFDAGLIEAAIAAEPKIESCGLAPEYDKLLHDTIPILYVQTSAKGDRKKEAVLNAIKKVFITDDMLKKTNMPGKCVITDDIPYNGGGKVDVYRLTQGEGQGDKYDIKQVRKGGKVTDLKLIPREEGEFKPPGSFAFVPEELRDDLKLARKMFERRNRKGQDGPMGGPGRRPMPGMPHGGFGQGHEPGMPPKGGFGNTPSSEMQDMSGMCDLQWIIENTPIGADILWLLDVLQSLSYQQSLMINQMYQERDEMQPVCGMPQMDAPQVYEEQESEADEEEENEPKAGGNPMNNPMIKNVLGALFNASTVDYYYED